MNFWSSRWELVQELSLTAEHKCIILKKEYRYPVNEVLYELPGGMIEEGEDPLETAKREI